MLIYIFTLLHTDYLTVYIYHTNILIYMFLLYYISMRVDGIQFDLLCEQCVCNVWRKRAFTTLCQSYREVDASVEKPQVTASLQIFRERVDFMIENTVPQNVQYSQKIEQLISANRLVTLRMIILTLYFTNLT